MFTEGSSPAALVGYGPAAVAACRGREASSARVAGRPGVAHGEGSSIPYVEQHEARNSLFQKKKKQNCYCTTGCFHRLQHPILCPSDRCAGFSVRRICHAVSQAAPASRNARMLASEARRAAGLVNRDVVVAGQVGP
jgi:hypothetical protein